MFRSRHPFVKIVRWSADATRVGNFRSQAGQDLYLNREFGQYLKMKGFPKTFLDVGCSDPERLSNSYFFEIAWGFSCIAVDPIKNHASAWSLNRPKARFHSLALGRQEGAAPLVTFAGNDSTRLNMHATLRPELGKISEKGVAELVAVSTAQALLDSHKVKQIGILSLDVEGSEFDVLSGIDFDRTTIFFLLVENNAQGPLGSERLRRFLRGKGFRFHARFWALDDLFVNDDALARLK